MIAIPAVDLRGGACVQLVGGSYEAERVRLDDPAAVARGWERYGFHQLHVVDLDAATGRGNNSDIVREILRATEAQVQVGGGVRNAERIEELLSGGAERVVVGTRALEDPDWLAEMAGEYPDVLVLAADVRERRIVTRGWDRTLPLYVLDVIESLNDLPLAAVMVTAVHREGQMQGTDLPLIEDVVERSDVPVFASGGVGGMGDLHALADRGVAGVIIGMALYTGALDPWAVAEEFSQ